MRTAKILFLLLLLLPLTARDRTWLNEEKPTHVKKAIVILPGMANSAGRRAAQLHFFRDKGFDVYVLDFFERSSLADCEKAVLASFKEYRFSEYKELHLFVYILGGHILNRILAEKEIPNLKSIVYDRSPLQERAPQVVMTDIPRLGRLAGGQTLDELSRASLKPMTWSNISTGLIVESKATPLIRRHRETTLALGPVKWNGESFNQQHADLCYTWLNHFQVYKRFDIIGADILYFFKHGKFTPEARREPWDWDHFQKYKE